jgi:hypothetical protein
MDILRHHTNVYSPRAAAVLTAAAAVKPTLFNASLDDIYFLPLFSNNCRTKAKVPHHNLLLKVLYS